MPRQNATLQKLGTNRNILLGVGAAVGSMSTGVLLDAAAVDQNGATPGVITTITCVASALLITIVSIAHMITYARLGNKAEPLWFTLPILAMAFVYTIVVAFLVSFYG